MTIDTTYPSYTHSRRRHIVDMIVFYIRHPSAIFVLFSYLLFLHTLLCLRLSIGPSIPPVLCSLRFVLYLPRLFAEPPHSLSSRLSFALFLNSLMYHLPLPCTISLFQLNTFIFICSLGLSLYMSRCKNRHSFTVISTPPPSWTRDGSQSFVYICSYRNRC